MLIWRHHSEKVGKEEQQESQASSPGEDEGARTGSVKVGVGGRNGPKRNLGTVTQELGCLPDVGGRKSQGGALAWSVVLWTELCSPQMCVVTA